MATIGQTLTAPESGWRRYDDTDSRIKYTGAWSYYTNYTSANNSTIHANHSLNDSLIFKFYGTKLRLLLDVWYDAEQTIKVTVDDIDYTVNGNPNNMTNTGTSAFQVLVFEKLNLSSGVHTVKIINTLSSGYNFIYFDAIDIDDTGYLVHPILSQVSDFSQVKNIGDCVPYHYKTATSGQIGTFSNSLVSDNEIPIASSATPDGLFYWVYVGKDYLGRKKFIADRNIQHSISWDVLNKAGLCGGVPLNDYFCYDTILPAITSNNMNGYIITASSDYDGYRYKAFNKIQKNLETDGAWITNASQSGWLCIELPSIKLVEAYRIKGCGTTGGSTPEANLISRTPTSWTFEGSNDGVTWDILDTQTNYTSWGKNERRTFKLNKTANYIKYRIKVSTNGGGTYLAIGEFDLLIQNSANKNLNFCIQLLTGGTSATDLDNEWDKIMVNSTLGGIIAAGDNNNIWNWSGIYSWSSTTVSGTNTNRATRGNATVSTNYSYVSSYIGTSVGFRPVLLVEQLVFNKFLIKKDSKYYSIDPKYYDESTHLFTPLTLAGGTDPNGTDIDNFGFNSLLSFISSMTKGSDTFKPCDKLNNCEIKCYTKK